MGLLNHFLKSNSKFIPPGLLTLLLSACQLMRFLTTLLSERPRDYQLINQTVIGGLIHQWLDKTCGLTGIWKN